MNQMKTTEQERIGTEPAPDPRPRGRPQKAPGDEKPQIRDEAHAEEIVKRVGAFVSAGVRPSRILAECESGITAVGLENLLAETDLEDGGSNAYWWARPGARQHLVALEKWADEEDASAQRGESFARTAVFIQVYGLLRAAHTARSLVAVTGLYGIGKTFAARQYVFDRPRTVHGAGAVLFEFTPAAKGDGGVLDAILLALEPHSPIKGTSNAKLERILSLLRPGDFLIADECGIPAERGTGLRFMSYINEQAGVPVAMIGNPAFHSAVWGKRTDYDALASRTRHVSLGGNKSEDVDAFMSWRGMNGRRWKDALLAVARLPGRDGGLRGVALLLDELPRLQTEITPESFLNLAKSYGRTVA